MNFSQKIKHQDFLVTVELSPPKGTDASRFLARAKALAGKVDAINVPDCQRSILKMSSLAAAKLLQDEAGLDAIWQLTCRDRNLIALQADLLGAYALGLRTVLALTGDPVQVGDQRDVAKQVFHLDSVRMLDLLRVMNDGQDATGKPFKNQGTGFTVGAALNPSRLQNPAQRNRILHKLERGVDFFQTQPVYDRDIVEQTLALLEDVVAEVGCPRPKVLLGIIPPRSAEMARQLNHTIIGVNIPESFIAVLERAQDPQAESIHYCAEVVQTLRGLGDGFHLMPVAMENRVETLLAEACLLPHPSLP